MPLRGSTWCALGNLRVGLRGLRPHPGLPVCAAGCAATGAAPHTARRAGDRALRHSAGGPDRTARRLPEPVCTRAPWRARQAGFFRGAGLLAFSPEQPPGGGQAADPRPDLHGPPPGHDAGGAGQRVAGRRGAALGHGPPAHRGRRLAAARARTARDLASACTAGLPAARHAAVASATAHARAGARSACGRADAAVIQRPLQRELARQRRRHQPLRGREHPPLARRRAARCLGPLSLPSPIRGRPALLADPAPGAGPGGTL